MASVQFDERDAGLLMVYADTGKGVTEQDFHDWYEGEHIPLRTSSIEEFLSAARYQVTSSSYAGKEAPSSSTNATFNAPWCALYTISSNGIFTRPAYTDLRAHRSAREADVIGRLAVLDRRIYRLVYDSAAQGAIDITADSPSAVGPAPAHLEPLSKAAVQESAPFVVATSVTPAAANKHAYDEWYAREHVGMLKKVPGWRRTRRYELVDALVVGTEVDKDNAEAKSVPTCLGLHEYDNDTFEQTPEYKAALSTEWRQRVIDAGIDLRERRVMKLYKAFEPEAALNAAIASQQK